MNQLERIRILVVDDDPEISDLFAFTFNLNGYRVYFAQTGNGAKEVLAQQPVDVVLCDVHMPGGNGLDLLNWVRKSYPEIKVVIATGDSNISRKEVLEKGASLLFFKPMSFKEADRQIRELFEKKSQAA